MSKIFPTILASLLILLQISEIYSFDVATHSAASERAVGSSNLDGFLKSELNFPGGINEFLAGTSASMRVFEWVQEGTEREDDGDRFCNHFHNPLLAWGEAGLSIPCSVSGNNSSVIWGQSPDLQPMGEEFTWQNARQSYFSGLTASTQAEREQQLALAFRTLGQLIHLVQDASLPAHTRVINRPNSGGGFKSRMAGPTGRKFFH